MTGSSLKSSTPHTALAERLDITQTITSEVSSSPNYLSDSAFSIPRSNPSSGAYLATYDPMNKFSVISHISSLIPTAPQRVEQVAKVQGYVTCLDFVSKNVGLALSQVGPVTKSTTTLDLTTDRGTHWRKIHHSGQLLGAFIFGPTNLIVVIDANNQTIVETTNNAGKSYTASKQPKLAEASSVTFTSSGTSTYALIGSASHTNITYELLASTNQGRSWNPVSAPYLASLSRQSIHIGKIVLASHNLLGIGQAGAETLFLRLLRNGTSPLWFSSPLGSASLEVSGVQIINANEVVALTRGSGLWDWTPLHGWQSLFPSYQGLSMEPLQGNYYILNNAQCVKPYVERVSSKGNMSVSALPTNTDCPIDSLIPSSKIGNSIFYEATLGQGETSIDRIYRVSKINTSHPVTSKIYFKHSLFSASVSGDDILATATSNGLGFTPYKVLYISHNLGKSWKSINVTFAPLEVAIKTSSTWWAIGAVPLMKSPFPGKVEYRYYLYRTTNEGVTWQRTALTPPATSAPSDLSIRSDLVSFEINNAVYLSSNSGKSFVKLALNLKGQYLSSVTFTSPFTGYALTSADTILKTKNAGRLWRPVVP